MKKAARLVLAAALVLIVAAVADAAVIKVKVQIANIRSQPDAAAAVLTTATLGTMFEASRKVGNWWEIAATDAAGKSVTGYINADIVDEVGAAAEPPTQPLPQLQPQPAAPQGYNAPPSYGGGSSGGKFLVMVGPVLSNLAISEDLGPDVTKGARFGFFGGIGYEFSLGPSVGLQLGAMFTTGGAKLKNGPDTMTYVENALIVPVQLKISLSGPYLTAGAYVGTILSPKITFDIGGTTGEEDIASENQERLLYGLLLGGGFEFDLGGVGAFIGASYNLGLNNLNKTGTTTIKFNAINFIIGLKL